MNTKKIIKTFILSSICLGFFSCASVAELNVSDTGDVKVTLSIKASKNTEVLMQNLAGDLSGIFNAEEISKNLKTENIQTLSFTANSLSSISGSFEIPKERVESSKLFVVDLQNKQVACNISKENLAPLIKTFPKDIKDYLDLFISPIVTGENLTADEYESLISSVYGPNIANELKTSFFKVVLSCPGVIESVKSEPEGRVRYFAGNSATLTVPLSYVLTLDKALKISILYK